MQRTASVLFASLFAGLLLTGCPEKQVEKEEPAAPTAVDKSGAEEKDKAAAEEEHGEDHPEADEPKDDKKASAKKKKPAGEEKDQGGW
jgi:hypothetical protein